MKLSIKVGSNSLELEGDDVELDDLKASLDAFVRVVDPVDETVSDEAISGLKKATERVEGLNQP